MDFINIKSFQFDYIYLGFWVFNLNNKNYNIALIYKYLIVILETSNLKIPTENQTNKPIITPNEEKINKIQILNKNVYKIFA